MRPLHLLSETAHPTLAEVAATHCRAIKLSLTANTFTTNKIINNYTKCNELHAAQKLFDGMSHRDTSSWNTIITGYANSGNFFGAWEVLKSMKARGFCFDGYTFVSMLKGVTIGGGVVYGQLIHTDVVKTGFNNNIYSASALLSMYAKFSEVKEANKVFQNIPEQERDTSSWNTIITGHVNSGNFRDAWKVLKAMKRLGFLFDGYTFGSILKGIAIGGSIVYGRQVHSDVVTMGISDDVYTASALLDMYAKSGSVEDAEKVFRYMPERNTVSLNALIAGNAEMGNYLRCVDLFMSMEQEGVRFDDGTFTPLLTLFDDEDFYDLLRQLHGKITKSGLDCEKTVVNSMITAYSGCGCIGDSERVFYYSADGYRDLVTWNSLLAAYLDHGMVDYVFKLFQGMVGRGLELDSYSYSNIISACFSDAQQILGKSLHSLVKKKGLEQSRPVANALMSMYIKSDNSSMEDAIKVFKQINLKDLVSWNTILTGLSQKGQSEIALMLFCHMHLDYLGFDQYTFAAVLKSCSVMATVQLGRQIHVLVVKSGFEQNEFVASALIFMYSKCGIIEDSRKSFDASKRKTSVTWNSIIFAYAQHGQGKIALDLFYRMKHIRVKMDHITFVAATTACSHIGLVEDGLKFLKSMQSQHGIRPQMENYACAIDLLGRAGCLMEMKELIKEMPFEPNAMVLKTLLGACRACRDIELAKEVAGHLLELEPGEHSTYVLLSEMYGQFKMWDEKAGVRRLMKEKGVKKLPGWSWIELKNDVHAFNAEDYSHPKCQEIYQILEELMNEIKISEDSCTLDETLWTLPLDIGE